jgi:WD40 repeat protein
MRSNALVAALVAIVTLTTSAAASQHSVNFGSKPPVSIGATNIDLLSRSVRWDQEQVNHLAWAPDANTLAIASVANPDVVLRDTQGNVVRTLRGHTAGIRSVVFNRAGTLLASASNDHTAKLWSSSSGHLTCTIAHADQVIAVAFNPSRDILASSGDDGVIILTNTNTCATVRQWRIGKVVASLAFNRWGTQLAVGGQNKTIQLWNPSTGRLVRELSGHSGWVWSLAFSPTNDDILASAGTGELQTFRSADNAARMWNTRTGLVSAVLPSESFYMLSAAFNKDGTVLATSSRYESVPQANNVRLWSVKDGVLLRELPGTAAWVNVAAFNSSGTMLALGIDARAGNAGSVEIWTIP